MQKSARWLLAAGILVLGCRANEQSTAGEHKDLAKAQVSPQNTTDKALVQVVVFGLGVLKRDHDSQGNLTGLSAYFTKETDHDLVFDQGVYANNIYKWDSISDAQGHKINIEGNTILFKMTGALGEEKKAATLGKYPKDPNEAADTGWILQAKEIDDPTDFDETQASVTVPFQTGYLETCALVFPPQTAGTDDQVCAVKVPNDKGVDRGLSEILVVRGLVPKSTTGPTMVEVELDGMQTQTIQIPATGGKSVTWQGVSYDTVINIAVGNVFNHANRVMTSDHADKHLKPLFSGASRSWYMQSSDCDSAGKCSCMANRQPACWTAYFAEFFRNTPSGYDRPICPLVGWNP